MDIKVEGDFITIDVSEEEREGIKSGRYPTGTVNINDNFFIVSIGHKDHR